MSAEYDKYLLRQAECLSQAFEELKVHNIISGEMMPKVKSLIEELKKLRCDKEEYDAYDAYFFELPKLGKFNTASKKQKIEDNFAKAYLHHIHYTPSTWEHWIPADENSGPLEMPEECVYAMICNWWTYSMQHHEDEIFGVERLWQWYAKYRFCVKLHPNTRKLAENIIKTLGGVLLQDVGIMFLSY